jgi:hypothetical protein
MVRAMNLARLTCVLVFLASVAHAEDCAFEAKAIKPQFATKLPKGFKLVSTKKEKRQITQVLKTPDGFEVALTLSGCEHVAFAFAIKGGGLTSKTVGAELVAVSKRVLPTLPLAADATADAKLFLKALDEANISTMPAQLPCGDATCQLSLEADAPRPTKGKKPKKAEPEKEPAGVLKLSYDFAL